MNRVIADGKVYDIPPGATHYYHSQGRPVVFWKMTGYTMDGPLVESVRWERYEKKSDQWIPDDIGDCHFKRLG